MVHFYVSTYRGFGFIRGRDGKDYFAHISEIGGDGFKTLEAGQCVQFEPHLTMKGWQAKDIHVVAGEELVVKAPTAEKLRLTKNPFSPQDPIVDPAKFAGRKEPFQNAVYALYNNKNLLITGPRGIGKSSISYQLLYLTQGETGLVDRLDIDLAGFEFDYISGDHRCTLGNTVADIASGLLTNLQNGIHKHEKLKESKVSVTLDLKFFKANYDATSVPLTSSELATQFASEVERVLRQTEHYAGGISFLIDEVDVLEDKVDLASFLKAAIEKFRMDGIRNICFIVSGVTGTATTLLAQHPSANRLFEGLELQRMVDEELEELIEVTLAGTGVTINDEARQRIIALSNRFPQPVQLLGYHSFRIDRDECIDIPDVNAAVEFIVQNLRRQEFNDKLEQLGRGMIKDILRIFAVAPLETVSLNYVLNPIPVDQHREVLGNLGNLEQWGIVEKQHRGVYRFREPLFKIYLRWVFGID